MRIQLEHREEILTATVTGTVEFVVALEMFKTTIDSATEKGCSAILIDCSDLEGELSTADRYTLGEETANHESRGRARHRIALVGKPPTFDGFGAMVARNRGVNVRIFPTREGALEWLGR
jgi:hypothetical protein